MLVVQQQKLYQLQLKIKYLVLVVQSRKQTDTKISELEKKLADHHDKYITASEFNMLAASVFNARLAQANLTLS